MMKRLVWGLALLLLLTGCAREEVGLGDVPGAPRFFPTATATRGALATSTPGEALAVQPSATPDLALVPEEWGSEQGVLSFRHPPGWRVSDHSDESEIVVAVNSPAGGGPSGAFIVNLQNVGGELPMSDLHLLADTYLRSLFGDALDSLPVNYREEGEALLATVIADQQGETLQFELRFAPRPPFSQVLVLIAPPDQWDQSAPLLDAMARSVSVNPAQAPTLATPTTVAERQSEGLAVQNSSLYRATTNSLYLVGEVINQSDIFYEDVQVTVTLLDAEGAAVGAVQWPVARQLLPPGERSPLVVILDQPPEGAVDYHTTVEALPSNYYLQRISSEFELVDVAASEPALGEYALTGQIRNVGPDARFIEVTGVLYDEAGRVLAVESASLERDMLSNGEQTRFAITFYHKAEGTVARHEVFVEGRRVSVEE